MIVSNDKLFPYPVLWFLTDDYKESNFEVKIDSKLEFGKLELEYEIVLENEDLSKLILEGKAMYCIHIENSLTTFRHKHLSSNKEGKISLDAKNINHKIDISTFIIAQEDIDNYKNQQLNEDYRGLNLNVKKGSILAIGEYQSITIDKNKNDLGIKESIFSITKNLKNEPMQFEIMNDRIIIKLGSKDFENYQMLEMNSKYRDIIYSMFIVPALIYVFENIANSENIEEYSEFLWFRSLEKCLNSNGINLDPNTIKKRNSYELAQKLLDDPISKALNSLIESGDY